MVNFPSDKPISDKTFSLTTTRKTEPTHSSFARNALLWRVFIHAKKKNLEYFNQAQRLSLPTLPWIQADQSHIP
jgi:hypothetical protein